MMPLVLFVAILVPAALGARLPYIVGGRDAEPGSWPWQASLQRNGDHICGSAVISDRWVVTASHCLGGPASAYTVILGLHDRKTKQNGDPKSYKVRRYIQHPDWQSLALGVPNDIALLNLATPADFSSGFVKPVELPEPEEDFTGSKHCFITGWGNISMREGPPNILQEAQVDVYSNEQCREKHGGRIADYHICVGKAGQSGACQRDSGGPLSCLVNGRWKLAGVTSWGKANCSVNAPTVYTRISHFRKWIKMIARV